MVILLILKRTVRKEFERTMNTTEKFVSGADEGIQPALPTPAEFEVVVIFTRTRSTLRALKVAGRLAKGLGARIRVIVPQVISYPTHLSEDFVESVFLQFPLRTIVGDSRVETRIDIRLCQDQLAMLRRVLPPHSLVVLSMGSGRRLTAEFRLGRDLEAAGHQVIFVNPGLKGTDRLTLGS